jgi:hypothetical protein
MILFDILGELADAFCSWRLYVCLIPALIAAYFLHESLPDARWPWLISVPLVLSAFALGLRWEWKTNR